VTKFVIGEFGVRTGVGKSGQNPELYASPGGA